VLHARDRGVARQLLPRLGSLASSTLKDFVALCESDSVASWFEKCQTHRTVGLKVLALIGTPAATRIIGELPRLI
jgi:hypothetical protein